MLSVKAFSGKIIWYFLYSIVSDGSENLIYITIFEEKFDKGELKLRKWDHIRRGELMQDTYWKQFMMSGKIDDYLNYKNSGTDDTEDGPRHNRNRMEQVGKQPYEPHESDQSHGRMGGK